MAKSCSSRTQNRRLTRAVCNAVLAMTLATGAGAGAQTAATLDARIAEQGYLGRAHRVESAAVLERLLDVRVRETHKKLAARRDPLRVQNERDPLTNLANRRHFQDVMALQGG